MAKSVMTVEGLAEHPLARFVPVEDCLAAAAVPGIEPASAAANFLELLADQLAPFEP
jgi:hypothetical protein